MPTHSSILAWEIPWTGAWWATTHGIAKSDTTKRLTHSYNVNADKVNLRSKYFTNHED